MIRKMLRHLKRAADPPPIAPAHSRQEFLTGSPNAHNVVRGLVGDVRTVEVYLTPLAFEIPFEIPPSPLAFQRRLSRGLLPIALQRSAP
jgi:hypothetical protein